MMAAGAFGKPLAVMLAIGGMISALALFNALLLSYSRIPLAMANDSLLPRKLAKLDRHSTPRNAILVSAICYSVFALLSFVHLVVADVLLYSMALFLEFAALIALAEKESGSSRQLSYSAWTRWCDCALRCFQPVILVGVVALEMTDGEYGGPAILGALAALLLGPIAYAFTKRAPAS
jgi:amino acid transporter